jgi:hypothetical protein
MKGRELALELAAPQSRRIGSALEQIGLADRTVIEHFLKAMVNPSQWQQIDSLPQAG